MRFKSIRSRLAFSFAGIALFVAIVLGAVLLPILRYYYWNVELNYLRGNAQVITNYLADSWTGNVSHDTVQSQIENLAFLLQTRIQVYDIDDHLSYDSGSPQNIGVNLSVTSQILPGTNSNGTAGNILVFPQSINKPTTQNGNIQSSATPENDGSNSPSVQISGSPFGFYLNGQTVRSTMTVTEQLLDTQNSKVFGTVKLSEGPAYGSAILVNVAKVWALSGLVALLLAAGVGWFISRRFSAPVLALTNTTGRMAQGDLSSRAGVETRDEFGQLAHSFNEMADRVEGTVNTLRTFVSDAAHEINTPLTALRTNLELAEKEQNLAKRENFIHDAIQQNKRLENLTNELLDLSRLEASKSDQDFGLFDLHDLIAQSAERFASRADQSFKKFNLILPDRKFPVYGSQHQIQRALENLLENALKFTRTEDAITLEAQANENEIVITIQDTGIGIPPEDLPYLFQRFHRGQNSIEYSGNGLGLTIVKAIVDLHDGTVEADSAGEGKGSKFSIRLPKRML